MRKHIAIVGCCAVLAGAACTPEEQIIGGALIGTAGGVVAANVLDANPQWTTLLIAGGAVTGALVARNNQTGECAYKRADGRLDVRPCP